ncbi:MAG: 2-keto-4-pentenoate hydratase [Actinophytocola sp.]|uniref:2-keto-4-pentenoate hydratase n=1 Tax=Actinophytocola sp. TaxID=1872138 RepID=UPI001326CD83|nr:fumarylacetoacetate hydrolase family protein [Actinophytocola sp.]MPZ83597.1 2-keto-4-pentenoate hydratase [Actinophytocola sp.]
MSDAATKAKALYEARRTRRPIEPFTATEPDLTMEDGYRIQRELVALLLADGEEIVGYKVGLTSEAMQRQLGVSSPDHGPVFESTVYRSGAAVAVGELIAPRVEAEIAFVLGSALRGPGVTRDDAAGAVRAAVPAIEIIDSRIADWRIGLADTVADLASSAAVVLGDEVPLLGADSRELAVVLERDGAEVASGVGAAALGDPVGVLAWLANVLGPYGVTLEPGQVIMTGALHAAVPLAAGDTFTARFDLLGEVRAAFRRAPSAEHRPRRRARSDR